VSLLTTVRIIAIYLAIGFLVFTVTTLGILILYPYAPDPGFSSILSESSLLGAPLSVILLFGVLYGWTLSAARRVIVCLSCWIPSLSPSARLLGGIRSKQASEPAESLDILSTLPRPVFLLGISLAAGIFLAWIPYRPDLNPTGGLIGIDTGIYVDWIARMLSLPPAQAVAYSFVGGLNGSRPLVLLTLYMVCLGGNSPSFTIQILPLFLAPSLSLAVYVFVYFGKGDVRLAGLTSLFTPFSYYLTTAMWGGYYANWLALVIGFLFLACLLRQSRSPTRVKYLVAIVLLSTILFLAHPWTWLLFASASAAFEFSLWFDTRRTPHALSLVGIVLPGVLLDYVKTLVFSTPSVVLDLTTKISVGGSVVGFWSLTVDGLLYTHSGLLANWLFMGLALVSSFAKSVRGSFERLLMFWVAAGSVSFLFLDGYNKARLVFDLPIPILGAMGVVVLLQRVGSGNVLLARLFFVEVLTLAGAYALQSMLLL